MTDDELDAEARRMGAELGAACREKLHDIARRAGLKELPAYEIYVGDMYGLKLYRIPAQRVDVERRR